MYPGVGDYKGLLKWTSHNQYEKEVKKADEQYGKLYAKFADMPIEKWQKTLKPNKSPKTCLTLIVSSATALMLKALRFSESDR